MTRLSLFMFKNMLSEKESWS